MEPCIEDILVTDPNLKAAIYYLGKFIDNNNIPEKEWLTFSLYLLKEEKGIIKFTNPSIILAAYDENKIVDESEIVSINEFYYRGNEDE